MNKILMPERPGYEQTDLSTSEQGSSGSPPSLGAADLLQVLNRRKWWLVGAVLLAGAVGVALAQSMTPLYTASTTVMVDPREQRIVDVEAIVAGGTADAATLESEIEVIQSAALARRVVQATGLDRTAEFNREVAAAERAEDPPLFELPEIDPVGLLRDLVLGPEEPAPADPEAQARLTEAIMLARFRGALGVSGVGRSRAIRITFTSEDPARARAVADAVAQLYITQQLEAKFDARQRANQWLGERLARLQEQVEAADRAVEAFRARAGVVEGRDTRLINEQLSQLNTQLILARAELNGARAQLNGAEAAVRQRGARAAFDTGDSPVVTNLRAQETTLRQREAELLNRLGPRHPEVQQVQGQLREIQSAIGAEAGNRLAALRGQVQVAAERVSSLEANMARLQQEAGRLGAVEVDMRQLERESEANRALYESFLNRFKETQEVDLDQPNAYVVSAAGTPLQPSFPNKQLVVAAALVLGAFLGLALVFVAEQLETGLQTQDDVERRLGERTLAMVPAVPGLGRKRPADYVLERPASAFAQSVKSLFTALVIAHQRRGGGNVILVTSAVPDEGKSSLAAALARIMSVAGRKALLVDCDLRRPQAHAALGLANEAGLSDFLQGRASLAQVIRKDPRSGADVITAGSPVDHPEEVLRNPLMEQLLAGLAPQYALVVLDTPPVAPVSDALVLAERASQVVVAARWRRTPAKLVEKAVRRLREAGANVAGVALTRVDVAKAARYGAGEADYTIGRRGSYFKN